MEELPAEFREILVCVTRKVFPTRKSLTLRKSRRAQ